MNNKAIEKFCEEKKLYDTKLDPSTYMCPACELKLIKGSPKYYETLVEHVCDPNNTIFPLRDTWICKNQKCKLYNLGFWDETGGYYGSVYDEDEEKYHIKRKMLDKIRDYNYGTLDALNSPDFQIHQQLDKTLRWINLKIIQFHFVSKYRIVSGYGTLIKDKVEIEIINYKGHKYISGIHMLKYLFENYSDLRKKLERQLEEDGDYNEYTLLEYLKEFKGSKWDKRWWKVLYTFIINFFHTTQRNYFREYCKSKFQNSIWKLRDVI